MATFEEKLLEEAYSVTPNYDVDYADDRFGKVETDKQQALTELEQTYGGIVNSSSKYYDDLINANQQWADKQAQIQQENTDFAIEKIEQQKEQAQKDYTKEQSGAYVDYKKQSNAYGTNAEKMASAGLTNTGYAESSQVSMYNTYQMRVAAARETLAQAKLNYDNNIKEAMLANNAALAQIYADAYIKEAELALEGFQYKNELMLEMVNKKTELDNIYYSRYQDVLQQINTENALKEDIRQYQETQKWNTEQARLDREHDSAENELQRAMQEKIAQAELDYKTKKDELDRLHELALQDAKTADEKEIIEKQWEIEEKKITAEKNAKIAQINAQAAADQSTLKYEYQLKNIPTTATNAVKTVAQAAKSVITGKSSSGTKSSTNAVSTAANKTTAMNRASKVKTKDAAVSLLKSVGINASGIMDVSEWTAQRHFYTMYRLKNASTAVTQYTSYPAYLQAYTKYLIAQKYGVK